MATIYGTYGDDVRDGTSLDDTIYGGPISGDPLLEVGNDKLNGNEGNDTIYSYGGNDILTGGTGNDYLDGGFGNNILNGDDGNDRLRSLGSDTLSGGSGNDYIANYGAGSTIDGGMGTNEIVLHREDSVSDLTFVFVDSTSLTTLIGDGTTVVNGSRFVLYAGDGGDTFTTGDGSDYLYGYGGDDTLTSGGGSDGLDGGAGDDTLNLGDGGGWAFGQEGNDTLIGGKDRDLLSGYTGDDFMSGGGGPDHLNGGPGADTMAGGGGDDEYEGVDAGDLLVEGAGEGTADRVLTRASYTLGTGVQVEVLTADNIPGLLIDLTGNEFAQTIIGNAEVNIINGMGGADTMYGYGGNDTYYVDSPDDVVEEAAFSGSGIDHVFATVSFELEANVEDLTLVGIAALAATGNELGNVLDGSAGDNRLDGKAGADSMWGREGDDTYYVENAGDTIHEAAGFGDDVVLTSRGLVLAAGASIEKLTTVDATAAYAINLFGNEFAQTIVGNAGPNILDGKVGADVMYGYGGNDTYYLDQAGDIVMEANGAFGSDKVIASTSYALAAGCAIETLSTANGLATTAINLTGNEFAQTIIGNAGANIINGKGRSDVLYGYGGLDTFVFNSAIGPGNIDRIMDFSTADDTIRLENAVFTALSDVGRLAFSQFWSSASGQAHDANDRIIYETDTGKLFYDADGTGAGAAVQFAALSASLDLTRADFYVV